MNYVDLHCHLLWGIDDGAKTEADSLAMARALVACGFTDVACSPHARIEYPSHDVSACDRRRGEVQEALEREGIALRLHPNAENVLDPELPARLEAGKRTIGTGGYLLAEAPYFAALPQLTDLIFRLKLKGVTPLIAHPERCKEFERAGRAAEAVRAGARLQLDIGALIGRYGRTPKKLARSFLEEGLYSVASTDLHSPTDAARWVGESIAELRKLAGEAASKRMLSTSPGAILRGEPLE
ncbi:tyrosine-protein phosphatase [Vulgatibacter incomptus]|uniref:protein-tyrosine-phosphatase n=1 Tax=Vulgatibacter incomptus TaxID=1391653 RepID=A0A0K1PCU7_9BACT|nr:CpsB/CapC family capsule biosynthesis tyrosine phosphatase [Vulgatibacter incomptus]AKU91221.1 Manganese-dependent protein-tyrosine phosphatase [Vulgatibacter incomptus]